MTFLQAVAPIPIPIFYNTGDGNVELTTNEILIIYFLLIYSVQWLWIVMTSEDYFCGLVFDEKEKYKARVQVWIKAIPFSFVIYFVINFIKLIKDGKKFQQ